MSALQLSVRPNALAIMKNTPEPLVGLLLRMKSALGTVQGGTVYEVTPMSLKTTCAACSLMAVAAEPGFTTKVIACTGPENSSCPVAGEAPPHVLAYTSETLASTRSGVVGVHVFATGAPPAVAGGDQ
jgi:hypothetical protein